jgi:4-amino-4-deoxy-L-arabinose transferase-like glycosyltransferase
VNAPDQDDSSFAVRLGGVLAAAAALRAIYLVLAVAVPDYFALLILDSTVYDAMASRILGGDLAADDVAYRLAPLYAYFVALVRIVFGDGLVAIFGLQQVIGLGSVALTGLIARRCFGARAGIAAAAMIALVGVLAMHELKLLSSTLAVFLSLLAVYDLLRARDRTSSRRLLVSGLILGLACIARPNTLLFCPLAAGWLFWRGRDAVSAGSGFDSRSLLPVVWLTLGVLLVIAPVTIRNYHVQGEFILISSQSGVTLYQGNNERSTGVYTRIPGLVAKPSEVSEAQRELAERDVGHSLSLGEAGAYWRNKAITFWVEHPGSAAWLMLRKAAHWFGSDEIATEYVLSAERMLTPALWLMPLPFGVILGFAALGVRRVQFGGRDGVLLALFIASNLASVVIFYFSSRYRLPAIPFVAMFAGCGLVEVVARFRESAAAALRFSWPGLVVTALSLVTISSAHRMSEASQFWNYGATLSQQQKHGLAAENFEHSLRGFEDNWQVHHYLALSYVALDDLAGAVRQHERALELLPNDPRLRRLLAAERAALRTQAEKPPDPAAR